MEKISVELLDFALWKSGMLNKRGFLEQASPLPLPNPRPLFHFLPIPYPLHLSDAGLLKAAIDNGDDYEAEFSFLKHNTGKMLRYRGAT